MELHGREVRLIMSAAPPFLQFSESFNATTSIVQLGTRVEQVPFAQTVCAVVNPAGAGEVGTNTVFSVNSAANVNDGTRFRFGDSGGFQIFFNANSTGTAGAPTRTGTDVLTYLEWHFTAATWDGTLTATGIRLFYARDMRSLTECTYGTTTNGTTAVAPGIGKPVAIGNRPDAGRTFSGEIAYVARWQRVLVPAELERVQRQGPLAIPDGLILCYANGRDYGPYGIQPVSKAAVAVRAPPTKYYPLGPTPARRVYFEGISFDANSDSGYQTAQSTYSWNHTCGGTDRYLRVGISMLSVAGSSVSSITYNGVALSLLRAKASVSGAVRAELWELVAPAIGTHSIAVTLSASLDSIGTAISLNGVHQTSPSEGAADATATNVGAADATVNVTTVADNDWVSDIVASDDTAITVGAGQTQRVNVTGTLGSGALSTEGPKTPAGSVTMSWANVGALATWTIVAAAVRPIAAASLVTGNPWSYYAQQFRQAA